MGVYSRLRNGILWTIKDQEDANKRMTEIIGHVHVKSDDRNSIGKIVMGLNITSHFYIFHIDIVWSGKREF